MQTALAAFIIVLYVWIGLADKISTLQDRADALEAVGPTPVLCHWPLLSPASYTSGLCLCRRVQLNLSPRVTALETDATATQVSLAAVAGVPLNLTALWTLVNGLGSGGGTPSWATFSGGVLTLGVGATSMVLQAQGTTVQTLTQAQTTFGRPLQGSQISSRDIEGAIADLKTALNGLQPHCGVTCTPPLSFGW